MSLVFIYSLLATLLVSLMSFAGVLTLSFKRDYLNRILLVLISLSAGTLLGDVFFHLLPEAIEESGFSLWISVLVMAGFLIFFVLEKFVMWHHHHTVESPDDHLTGHHGHTHSVGVMNLFGDALHNFMDGMIIFASFMMSPAVGIGTTIAVVLHEIPQEVGDFGVLVHSGYSTKKALFFNFISAVFAILGAVFTWLVGSQSELFLQATVPLVSGGFIYIAATDLIPELRKEFGFWSSLKQFLALLLGILFMYGLIFLEGDVHLDEEIDTFGLHVHTPKTCEAMEPTPNFHLPKNS